MSKLNFVHTRGYRQVGQGHFGHMSKLLQFFSRGTRAQHLTLSVWCMAVSPGCKIIENILFGAALARKVFQPYSSGTQYSQSCKSILAILCWNKVEPLLENVLTTPRQNTVFQQSTARTLYQLSMANTAVAFTRLLKFSKLRLRLMYFVALTHYNHVLAYCFGKQ